MAKFNIAQVLGSLAQTATGMLQGQTAAEAELRRREMERQERVRQSHATMLQALPSLNRDAQATLLGGIFREQENMATGRPFDFQAPTPVDATGYRGPLGGGQAFAPQQAGPMATGDRPMWGESEMPQGPPAPVQPMGPLMSFPIPGLPGVPPEMTPQVPFALPVGQPQVPAQQIPQSQEEAEQVVTAKARPKPQAAATPKGRTISTRFGDLALRGVDPKEAQRVSDEFAKTRARIFNNAIVRDPNTQGLIQSAVRAYPTKPFSEWSEDDLAQARQAQGSLDNLSMFLGGQGQKFQQDMDTAEVTQIGKDLEKLSGFRADNLQSELIRLKGRVRGLMERGLVQVPSQFMAQVDDIDLMEQALAKGDQKQAGLILGLVRQELTPKPKDADPLKVFTDLLGQAPRWAGVDPATQGVYLRRLKQAAQDAGHDPAMIPNRVEAVMSDETKKRLQIAGDQLKLSQQRERRQAAEQKWRRDFDTRKANQQKRTEAGNLTEAEHKRIGKLEAARDAQYQRRNKILEMAPVDLKPGSENAATRGIKSIDAEIERLNGAIEGILGGAERRGGGTGKAGASDSKARREADRKKDVGDLLKELAEVSK